jgi:DNA-binding response OmpR family regulator
MQVFLFVSDRAQGLFIKDVLKAPNLHVDIVFPPYSFDDYRLVAAHAFLFALPWNSELREFLTYLRQYRPSLFTVGLFDTFDPSQIQKKSLDLIFCQPFLSRNIGFKIQEALFEKQYQDCETMVSSGNTKLDLFTREVCRNPYRFILRNKEFSLLQLFMKNPGKLFTRTDLLELVWDQFSSISTNTVDVHVSRLRRKLRLCRSNLTIKTIPCAGYICLSQKSSV